MNSSRNRYYFLPFFLNCLILFLKNNPFSLVSLSLIDGYNFTLSQIFLGQAWLSIVVGSGHAGPVAMGYD